MKIFFAKGLWTIPLLGAVLIVVFLVVMVTAAICDRLDRARYERDLRRAHRYRSF
ncbi:hypothetical protein AB6809_29440 [Paraburkholderia sp. RCC_158]|uniref:hypothetical protein n=1 Tax=Paraburkholderia sp. RCC_158 TaxID=3239220 RepID=UPI003524AB06